MSGRYIVVEGPAGIGKGRLAEKLADTLQYRLVLEQTEANPFLADFQREGARYAFQAQLFFLLSRFRQQQELSQLSLFKRGTVSDYLFDRDRLYALLNLSEAEFALYDQVFQLLLHRLPCPDLVVYLSAGTDFLWKRWQRLPGDAGRSREEVDRLNEAYHRFFFHYDRSALLVVNTGGVDLVEDGEAFSQLLKEINRHRRGVKHYVPWGAEGAGPLAGG